MIVKGKFTHTYNTTVHLAHFHLAHFHALYIYIKHENELNEL